MYKHWHQIDKIINKTLVLEPEERIFFLEKTFSGEPDVLKEAIDYLSFIERAETEQFLESDLLSQSVLADEISSIVNRKETTKHIIGKQIGPYVIRRLIGEGGMGAVYLAERTEGGFEQKVAIKFMRGGFYSLYLRERFNSEKQILSKLNHPNIARLLDGGITDDGSPYFIMEYVDGKPVDVYCRENNLKLNERLSLFQQICRAVQFAHSKLIIHRDLKPENIYITPDGEVKVMDFGIAKLLTPDADDELAIRTREGHIIASFEFAAPEQVGAGQPSVETDVYGLGALLYLLSTEEVLFQFKTKSLPEIESVIRSETPPNPRNHSKGYIGAISKDLESIILKALRKEPEQRYESVLHLREEIERHQKGFPVQARKGTLRYKTVKFLKRNRAGLAVSAFFIISAIGFTVYHIQKLTEERNISQIEAEKARNINNFMIDIFDASDPVQNVDSVLTAKDLVLRGQKNLVNQDIDASLKINLISSLAAASKSLGEYKIAENLYLEADSLSNQEYEKDSYEVSLSKLNLGDFYSLLRNNEKSEFFLQKARPFYNKNSEIYPRDYANLIYHLGNIYMRTERIDSSLVLLKESLNIHKELDSEQSVLLNIQNAIGRGYRALGKNEEAETVFLEILRNLNSNQGINDNVLLATLNNLALINLSKDQFEAALTYFLQALDLVKQIYDEEHPYTLTILGNIIGTNGYLKKEKDIQNYAVEYIRISKLLNSDNSWQHARDLRYLGIVYFRINSFEASVEYLNKSVQLFNNSLGPEHNWAINTLLFYAFSLFNYNHSEGEKVYNEAIEKLINNITTYSYTDLSHLNSMIEDAESFSEKNVDDKVLRAKEIVESKSSVR